MNKTLISALIFSAIYLVGCEDEANGTTNSAPEPTVVEEKKNLDSVSEQKKEVESSAEELKEAEAPEQPPEQAAEVSPESTNDQKSEVEAVDSPADTEQRQKKDSEPTQVASGMPPLRYLEGRDYQPLATTIEQVEEPTVVEFFWYGCPHCYDMHEPVKNWVDNDKAENVAFETVPAMPSARWEIGGHLYYTAKALDLDVDDTVFEQVHQQHNTGIILDEDKAKSFLVSQGVDKAQVEKAWKSFGVQQNVTRAKKLFNDSGLSGVPSFVVNGAYEVPFQGNYEAFFPKLEALAKSK